MCFVRHKEFYLYTQYHGSIISINVVKKCQRTIVLIFWQLPKFLRNQNFLECACTPSSTTLGVAWLQVQSNECAACTLTGNLFSINRDSMRFQVSLLSVKSHCIAHLRPCLMCDVERLLAMPRFKRYSLKSRAVSKRANQICLGVHGIGA